MVVDDSYEKIQEISDKVSYAMKADVTDKDALQALGARNLDGVVVAVSEHPEANIMETLICKELGIPRVFFFKQKTAYEIGVRLVGSEMCIRDRVSDPAALSARYRFFHLRTFRSRARCIWLTSYWVYSCLLYTSDAADEEDSVDLGGWRISKKKKKTRKKKKKKKKKRNKKQKRQ